MSDYKVKSNLKHDGTDYPKGSTIDLDEATAEGLLADGVIADPNAQEDEDVETPNPQPAVNNVKREGDDVDGDAKVEGGTVEKKQPGDGQDDDQPVKSEYTVLQGLEYPQGTAHEVGAVLELTEVEAATFADGLLEKVGDNL